MHIIQLKLKQRLMPQDKNIQIVKLWLFFSRILFQGHKLFLDEFAESLKLADKTYLCDIFGSARENHGKLSIQDLQDKIPGSEIIKEEDTCLH